MKFKEFDKPEYFVNRELSWIKFDDRVLSEGSGSCRVQKNRYCRNDSQGTAESHQPADT